MVFVNPFKRDKHTTFPGVVVPLASAPPHSHRNSEIEKPHGTDLGLDDHHPDKADKNSLDKAPSEENGVPSSLSETSHLTIDVLRAEVETDIGASGVDTAYDRMSFVVLIDD